LGTPEEFTDERKLKRLGKNEGAHLSRLVDIQIIIDQDGLDSDRMIADEDHMLFFCNLKVFLNVPHVLDPEIIIVEKFDPIGVKAVDKLAHRPIVVTKGEKFLERNHHLRKGHEKF
jgi:hypothetical protein